MGGVGLVRDGERQAGRDIGHERDDRQYSDREQDVLAADAIVVGAAGAGWMDRVGHF